jgi:hypothetical protein
VGAAVALDGPIAIGRGRLVPAAGEVRLLLAAGEPCGLLVGRAVFSYVVEDPFSVPVAKRNLAATSAVSGAVQGGKLVLSAPVDAAAVWSWELAAAAAGSAPAGEAGAAGPGPWIGEILDRPFFAPPSSELITARRLAGPGPIYALLKAGDGVLVAVDPVVERLESVWALEKLGTLHGDDKGRHRAHELAAQPIGRQWWEGAAAPAIVTRASINVDNGGESTSKVTTRSHVQAARSGVGLWRVALLDRTLDVQRTQLVGTPLDVLAVSVGGRPAEFLHQSGELLVALDPPLAKGGSAEVEVVHQGALAVRPGNDSYWSLGTEPWYPQPPLNAELAEVEIEVRVPEPFTPFASGTTVSREVKDGVAVLKTRTERPVQFPAVAAGKYHPYTEEMKGVTCTVASYAFGKEKESRKLMQNFFAVADYFGQLFGAPFPFPEIDIVEINSWGFGEAPPGVVFITQEAYNPIGNVVSRFFSQGVNALYVHEVAHSWWGHVIKMGSLEEQWLTESFAEYSAALALGAMRGGGKAGEREFGSLLRQWKSDAARIGDGASIFLANHLAGKDEEKDDRDRTLLLYSRGPVVLHALRQELARQQGGAEQGDRFFFALLRSFVKNFQGGYGETRHLVGILNQITGTDWQPWFERYVYGTETPAVKE